MGPLIVSPTLRHSPYLAGLGIGAEDATRVVTLTVDVLATGGCEVDEEETRVVVHCDVLRQLGCFAGDVVLVQPVLRGKNKEQIQKTSSEHVAVIDTSDGVLLTDAKISPLLALNMGLPLHLDKILRETKSTYQIEIRLFRSSASIGERLPAGSAASDINSVPKAAAISLIAEPITAPLGTLSPYPLGAAADKAVKQYFRKPRLLREGDTFLLRLIPDSENTASTVLYPIVAFRVTGVDDGDDDEARFLSEEEISQKLFVAQIPHSSIIQEQAAELKVTDAVESPIPLVQALIPIPSLMPTLSSSLTSSCLHQKTIQELTEIFARNCHPRYEELKVCTSVLLHTTIRQRGEYGESLPLEASGCGRRSIIVEAALRTGMRVLIKDSLKLAVHETAEDEDGSAVEKAILEAVKMAPCVLVLHNLGAALAMAPQPPTAALSSGPIKSKAKSPFEVALAAVMEHRLYASASPRIPSQDKMAEAFGQQTEKEEEISAETLSKALHDKRVIIVATATNLDEIESTFRGYFTHRVEASPPNAEERFNFFAATHPDLVEDDNSILWNVVQDSEGMSPHLLRTVVNDAKFVVPGQDHNSNYVQRLAHSVKTLRKRIFENIRGRTSAEIEGIPTVSWEDVGGLEDAKMIIRETVELPIKKPHLFPPQVAQRSGVLLFGPPGTGKTLLAKATAAECNLNFMSVKGPELLNMYVGESERAVRDVFSKARRSSPSLIFFDELDSLAPRRGLGGDSGGVMDRVVSQLLAEVATIHGLSGYGRYDIDGLGSSQGEKDLVVVMGATNRPDLLDPALLRPGRFEKLCYIGINSNAEGIHCVLQACSRKMIFDDSVSLDAIAKRCAGQPYTGADLYGICAEAWTKAVVREIQKGSRPVDVNTIVVTANDMNEALAKIKPSLTEEDVAMYQSLSRSMRK